MSFIRNIFKTAKAGFIAGKSSRAKRWAKVRHLDANAFDRRAVIDQNASEVLTIMRNQRELDAADLAKQGVKQ